jgi:lipoprotein-anchoring transpeptidase ErfK/SrfK
MHRKMKKTILAYPLLVALAAAPAMAQDWPADDQRGMVLVTPEGELLDYIPDAGDVVVKRNKRGQRVLIDHYGNMVATEMPARAYLSGLENRRKLPGVEDSDQRTEVYSNRNNSNDPNYFPERPESEADSGTVTGTVSGQDGGSQGFEDQPLPGDAVQNDNLNNDQDMAALEPLQPEIEQKPVDPVITLDGKKSKFEITALQVFLDREGASPGVIDGKMGLNVSKAILAYEKITGEKLDPNNSEDIMTRLGFNGGLPVTEYTITSADAAGPYVAAIPEDYSQKAALPSMAYTSVTEALAERFHMDENYLKELNPNADFSMPGTVIKVINPGIAKKATVARIVADKARKQLFVYGPMDELIAAYPASIGSSDTPSPSGLHAVERVALDPNYTYNPKINFQQGNNTKVLTIPPGPNGPVGTVWIALDKPTYGIHGTPDPSRIGRSQSHGCIRLTNWDATELAKMVKPGVMVEFID